MGRQAVALGTETISLTPEEPSTIEARWIVTLSNGETIVEHSGNFGVVPGERKPWVRLCSFLADEKLHITSLRLWFRGHTLHMPRERLNKFTFDGITLQPLSYSIQYHLEVDDLLGDTDQNLFIDLAAHYENFIVHYVQDMNVGDNSWVVVTEPHERLAVTPRRPG